MENWWKYLLHRGCMHKKGAHSSEYLTNNWRFDENNKEMPSNGKDLILVAKIVSNSSSKIVIVVK